MIDTALQGLLGCRVPIQQAPMGVVSTARLAVAVAEAGGIGTVAAYGSSAQQLDDLLERMTTRTSGTLCVNFTTADVDRDCVRVASARVRLVDFFWADPDASLVELVHSGGALACWQVGSLAEARAAALAGCDLVAVQGIEAGGHVRGAEALLPLLSGVLGELEIPVLAAGGIVDERSFAAVLAAGAAGARVGTRFIATTESGAHPGYKAAVVAAEAGDTQVTDAFPVCPLCATSPRARVLTSAVDAVRGFDGDVVGEVSAADGSVAIPRGSGIPPGKAARGHVEAMAMYAGMGVGSVRDTVPAGDVVDRLSSGAERLLRS